MEAELPDDVLHLVCDELRHRQDFSTLFNCAVSSRRLAPLALANLYRAAGPTPNDDDELRADVTGGEQLRQKWSIYWRSITLASLGKTLYPYQSYLRVLDLRDLGNLLDDLRSGYRNIEKVFFKGDLAKFRHVGPGSKWWPKGRLDIGKIVDDLGAKVKAIATSATRIEVISGRISPRVLQDWIPRFSRLQRLELEAGTPLGDENVRQAIYKHCPMFSELSILMYPSADADEKLGQFISGLPEQSLRVFEAISSCKISTETCIALNRHGKSLKTLQFTIDADAVPALALLGRCTSLESFKLEISAEIDMQESHKDIFDDFTVWLAGCETLREVQLLKFNSATAALTPLLLNENVRIETLVANAFSEVSRFKSYHGDNARIFHQALVNQAPNLQSLDIRGQIVDNQEPTAEDADLLINSVCQLKNLTSLDLWGIMDEAFHENHVISLLRPLQSLEDVAFGGWGITDNVLDVLSTLPNLKRVTVNALSRFTASGLFRFLERLGPGNQGFSLAVEWPDHEGALSQEDIARLTSEFEAKVNGIFEYMIPRDPFVGMGEDSDEEYTGGGD